jgi:hypothetical protein
VVQALDPIALFGPTGHRRVSRGLEDQLGLLKRRQLGKVAQALKAPPIPRQRRLTAPPNHSQGGFEPGTQALRPGLVPVPARVFLLRVVYRVMLIARSQPVAAGRIRIESTAGWHGHVGCLLHRLDRTVPCRVDHATPLAADPGDDRGPILVVMASPGLALLAATPGLTAQGLLAARLGWSVMTRRRREGIGFTRALHLAIHLVGHRDSAPPPTPALAGADMDAQLPSDTAR